MSNGVLPDQFQDLERFVSDWALATEGARNKKRLSSTMEEIQAFYDAMLPQMEVIIDSLNQFPPENMPEDARRLFFLALSMAEVAPAVELFKQPSVVDGFEPSRFLPVHVPHMALDES